MSTLRTDALQTTDSSFTVQVANLASSVRLANQTGQGGAADIGYNGGTVADALDSLSSSDVFYADILAPGGDLQDAADAIPNNSRLVIRTAFVTTTNIAFVGKTNVEVMFEAGGSVTGQAGFTFNPGYRGILVFDNCVNPRVVRPIITGVNKVKVFLGTIPSFQMDGDSGIEFYQCSGSRVLGQYSGHIRNFMGWGVIHVQCTDTLVDALLIEDCTQQSGVGHAVVTDGLVTHCTIRNIGLYGIEIEGTDLRNIRAYDNFVSDCLQGISMISGVKSCAVYNNTIEKCMYGVTLNTLGNPASTGNTMRANQTYDCLIHLQVVSSRFAVVKANEAWGRVPNLYLHSRAADFIWDVIDSASVLVPDFASASVTNGDVHQYPGGLLRTVQSNAMLADPIMGNCIRITYTEGTAGLSNNMMFKRFANLIGATSRWMYVGGGAANEYLRVEDNTVDAPVQNGFEAVGNITEMHYSNNKMRGVRVNFYAGDATALFTSTMSIKSGDCTDNTAFFGGSAQAKFFPSIKAERYMINGAKALQFGFANPAALATGTRVRLTVLGSSAASASVTLSLNGAVIATIPQGEFGSAAVYREVFINVSPTEYSFLLAGGGAMTVHSVQVEVSIVTN